MEEQLKSISKENGHRLKEEKKKILLIGDDL